MKGDDEPEATSISHASRGAEARTSRRHRDSRYVYPNERTVIPEVEVSLPPDVHGAENNWMLPWS